MFKLSFLVLSAFAALTSYAQVGKTFVATYAKKADEAKSLQATYSAQRLGGVPEQYSVSLSKPNLAKIETPLEIVVADGNQITSFSKGDKTYTRVRETDFALRNLFRPGVLYAWGAFFDPKILTRAPVAQYEGQRSRKGVDLAAVKVTLDMSNDHFETFYFDKDGLPRQADYFVQSKNDYILIVTDNLTLGDQPLDDSAFQFVPPAGSHLRP